MSMSECLKWGGGILSTLRSISATEDGPPGFNFGTSRQRGDFNIHWVSNEDSAGRDAPALRQAGRPPLQRPATNCAKNFG